MVFTKPIPVVLFVYKRQDKLGRVLECLKLNEIPLLIVYSDGPRNASESEAVARVRDLIRSVDWCEVRLRTSAKNIGLGRSIRRGVCEALREYGSAIIIEDDIECVTGTYAYMCAALKAYEHDNRVMSISAYSHPRLVPLDVHEAPYFDGRYSCWGWGTWRRAWRGMSIPAPVLAYLCWLIGRSPARYGSDLLVAAESEWQRNIWAARFALLHIMRRGLSLRVPWSMTNHMGFDDSTTSPGYKDVWQHPGLRPCPPIPAEWAKAEEHPQAAALNRRAYGADIAMSRWLVRKAAGTWWRLRVRFRLSGTSKQQ